MARLRVSSVRPPELVSHSAIPARMVAMPDLTPPDTDRQARIDELARRILPAAEAVARRMAEQLADRPDGELFGDIEYRLRDAAHDLAAAAHQTGLEARKKGGTTGRASSARAATAMPGSAGGGPAGS
eukprot:Opistho-1_new@4122